MSDRRPTGALEAEVLAALWAADGSATPGEVHAVIGDGLAYTTTMTILSRLWRKGLVDRERRGRAYAYRPLLSEAELTAGRMREQLDRAKDRDAVLMRFVGKLSRRDERLLRRVLGEPEGR